MPELKQGDIYWVDRGLPRGSEIALRRPFVIIQNNATNASRITTVIACPLTRTLRRGIAPGNVHLRAGEGNLPAASVVNVSQPTTMDRAALGAFVGNVGPRRVDQILEGVRLLTDPRD